MVGGISGWQLLILLLIVVLVFGTKRLRNIGSDLGSAIKGFRQGMENETEEDQADTGEAQRLSADPEEKQDDTQKKETKAAGQSDSNV